MTLALCAGEWGGRYKDLGCDVTYVEPDRWKGGAIPKDKHQPRIWKKLEAREKVILDAVCNGMADGDRHNVVDAVGIGLYAVGRQA